MAFWHSIMAHITCVIIFLSKCHFNVIYIRHNKHHILHIVLNETTKFTSNKCHEYWAAFCVRKTTFSCKHAFLPTMVRGVCAIGLTQTLSGWRCSYICCNLQSAFAASVQSIKFLESGFLNTWGDQIWTARTELCLTFNGVCVLFPKFLRERIRDQVS
jgi:hypothetical protein